MKYVIILSLFLGLARPAFAHPCGPVAMASAADSAWDEAGLTLDRLKNWTDTLSEENPEKKFLIRVAALNGVMVARDPALLLVPPGYGDFPSPFPSVSDVHLLEVKEMNWAMRMRLREAWKQYYREHGDNLEFPKIWEWLRPKLATERESRLVARGFEWGLYEVDPHAYIETATTFESDLSIVQSPESPVLVRSQHIAWKGTKLGYLSIRDFGGNSIPLYVAKELDRIRNFGARGLILDLRDNGGGQVINASKIGGYLMGKGKPMVYQEHIVTRLPFGAPTLTISAQRIDVPILVLVNNLTGSAAEILAGSLQHHGLAYLLGEPTYGKGTFLQPVAQQTATHGPLSGLPIYFTTTTALYYLPSGHSPQIYGLPIDFPYAQPGAIPWVREGDNPTAFPNPGGPIELAVDFRRDHLKTLFSRIEPPWKKRDLQDPQLYVAQELLHRWMQ